MEQSILTSTKNILGVPADYDAFDLQIITHINEAFSTLAQLGVGPTEQFSIEDADSDWEDFSEDVNVIGNARTYVYLKTRMLFDPPTTSYLISAMERQIGELEWRMNVYREGSAWVDPDPDVVVNDEVVI